MFLRVWLRSGLGRMGPSRDSWLRYPNLGLCNASPGLDSTSDALLACDIVITQDEFHRGFD